MENMKIEINEFQSVGEICKELERLGYKKDYASRKPQVVITWEYLKNYDIKSNDFEMTEHSTYTTLEELKKMERN